MASAAAAAVPWASSAELRTAANALFAAAEYSGAAAGYTAALDAAAADALPAVLALSNRAQCWLRLGAPVRALDDTWHAMRRCEAAGLTAHEAYAKVALRRAAAFEAAGAIPAGLELTAWALCRGPRAIRDGPVAGALQEAGARLYRLHDSAERSVYEYCPRPPPAACKALRPSGDAPPSRRFAGVAVLRDGVYLAGGRGLAQRSRISFGGACFDAPLGDLWRLPLPASRDASWRWERLPAPPVLSANPGPCTATAAGGHTFLLLPLASGGVWAYEPATERWRAVATPQQVPSSGVGGFACDADGTYLFILSLRCELLAVDVATGGVAQLAGSAGAPPSRLGGSLVVVDALPDEDAQPGDWDLLLCGGLDPVPNISLDDCWALRVRSSVDGLAAVGAWRRLVGEGGGVPPPPTSYGAACGTAASTGALVALVGGVSESLPGGPCECNGCGAPEVRPQLHCLRAGGLGWAPLRYTGDTPTTWAAALAPLPAEPRKLLLVCAGHNGFDDTAPSVALFQITLPVRAALAAAPSAATQPTPLRALLDADGASAVDTTSPMAQLLSAGGGGAAPPAWPGAARFLSLVDALAKAPVDAEQGWLLAWSCQGEEVWCIRACKENTPRTYLGLLHRPPRAVDLAWLLVSLCAHPAAARCRPATMHVGARCRHLLPALAPLLARLGIVARLETWQEAAAKALRHNTSAWGFNAAGTARCLACGAQRSLKKCSGCSDAPYCSKECAAADWPEHRPACVFLADCKRRMARGEPPPPPGGSVPLVCAHKRGAGHRHQL